MICIFCEEENDAKSMEHIVSEAFGNKNYVMKYGAVCDDCNNNFSAFEGKAVSQTVFVMERSRMGIPTKKGSPTAGRVGGLEISGNAEFEKNLVTMKGLTEEIVSNFDPEKGTFQVLIKTFDGTEVATSKLLLKMALESLYTSQRDVYQKYDFSQLRAFLLKPTASDWPFMTTSAEVTPFVSIPRFIDKYRLGKIRCTLKLSEVSDKVLLFKFKYGAVAMVINLIDREALRWMKEYKDADELAMIYPEHFRAKLERRLASKAIRFMPSVDKDSLEPEKLPAAIEESTTVLLGDKDTIAKQ